MLSCTVQELSSHCPSNERGPAALQLLQYTESAPASPEASGRLWQGSVYHYTVVLHAFVVSGDVDGALQLLAEMEAQGPAPDIAAYNCVAKGLCNGRGAEEAEDWLISRVEERYCMSRCIIKCHCVS